MSRVKCLAFRLLTSQSPVLTSPSITQSKQLYLCVSELNKMLSLLNPIDNLMNVLRDHKTALSQEEALKQLENPDSGVIITPMYDHPNSLPQMHKQVLTD